MRSHLSCVRNKICSQKVGKKNGRMTAKEYMIPFNSFADSLFRILLRLFGCATQFQKQSSRGVLRRRFSEHHFPITSLDSCSAVRTLVKISNKVCLYEIKYLK